MRVLLAPSAYYPHIGGIEETTRNVAAELRRRGHEVLIISNRWPHDLPPEEQIEEVTVRRVRLELPALSPRPLIRFLTRSPGAAASILAAVRVFRPDVVHLIGAGPNAPYVAALRRLLRSRIVLTTQGEFGADAHRVFERSLSLRWGLRKLLVQADALTGCSRFVLAELESAFPVSVPRQVIPNAVDPNELARDGRRSSDGRYVLGLGRLVEQKGFDVLLRAFARALPALPEHRLVIGGDGPLRPGLEALAHELDLDERVSFTGALDRAGVAAILAAAEIFVLSSRVEAFGIALLEAMAAGVPAVATDVGGVLDVATDGETALIVPSDDPDALASAIVRLASEPELRERLAGAARVRANELTWETIVPRYEAVYRGIVRSA
jgi:glycosyltransferase involved in cell wall biosynthesis